MKKKILFITIILMAVIINIIYIPVMYADYDIPTQALMLKKTDFIDSNNSLDEMERIKGYNFDEKDGWDFIDREGYDYAVRYFWLKKLKIAIDGFKNLDYRYIADNYRYDLSELENLEDTLDWIRRSDILKTFDFDGNDVGDEYDFAASEAAGVTNFYRKRSSEAFKNIMSPYESQKSVEKEIVSIKEKLNAAIDKKRGKRASGEDSETTGFIDDFPKVTWSYNKSQIKSYICKYGEQDVDDDLKKIWQAKLGIEDGDKEFGFVLEAKDLQPVSKDASYGQKMAYSRAQIWAYMVLYGDDYGKMSDAKKKTLSREWDTMLNTGSHTSFYEKNKETTKYSTYVPDNKVDKSVKNVVKNQERLDKIKKQKEDGEKIYKNIDEYSISRSTDNNETGNTEKKVDSDKETIFKQPTGTAHVSNGAEDTMKDAENFLSASDKDKDIISKGNLQEFSQNLYGILLAVGVVIAVIIGVILGVKLMLAPVGEKAEAKKLLIPYVVGCVVVFGAFGIWKLVVTIMQGI